MLLYILDINQYINSCLDINNILLLRLSFKNNNTFKILSKHTYTRTIKLYSYFYINKIDTYTIKLKISDNIFNINSNIIKYIIMYNKDIIHLVFEQNSYYKNDKFKSSISIVNKLLNICDNLHIFTFHIIYISNFINYLHNINILYLDFNKIHSSLVYYYYDFIRKNKFSFIHIKNIYIINYNYQNFKLNINNMKLSKY